MNLKLLVNSKSSKVLFAEADKEFVDFLYSLLALPLATVTRLLKQKDGMVGSLGVLYESIESIGDSFIQAGLSKETLLCPKVALPLVNKNVNLLKCEGVACADRKFYMCSSCRNFGVTDNPHTLCPSCSRAMNVQLTYHKTPATVDDNADTELYTCYNYCKHITETADTRCPSCGNYMSTAVTFVNPSSTSYEMGGYVKGVVTYMVMDDLDVKPMSTISSITMLNTFNIKDVGVLEEKIVSMGMDEALKLLQASLQSKNVLTDVFLRKTDA